MLKNRIIYNSHSDWTFDLARAKGSFLWDTSGKKYIDFTSGWNVANLGWNHPDVAEAVVSQARKNTYAPMWTADAAQNELADLLTKSLPKELNTVGRATGGTEANEEAMKTARAYTGRRKIIGFRETYHGQSFGVMALGWPPEYVKDIAPLVGDIIQIPFPGTYRPSKSPKKSSPNVFWNGPSTWRPQASSCGPSLTEALDVASTASRPQSYCSGARRTV